MWGVTRAARIGVSAETRPRGARPDPVCYADRTRPIHLALALGIVGSAGPALACKGVRFRELRLPAAQPGGRGPRIRGAEVSIERAGSFPLPPCSGLASIAFRVRSDDRVSGFRMRVLGGNVPFAVPDDAIALDDGDRALTTWREAASPAHAPFYGRIELTPIGPYGEGPPYEIDVVDRGSLIWLAWLGDGFWFVAFFAGVVLAPVAAWRHERKRRQRRHDNTAISTDTTVISTASAPPSTAAPRVSAPRS